MNNTELLKESRKLLLGLHKSLVDFERSIYERMHGTQTSGQFLNVLIEDQDFAWLRKISTLIVDIDEMFSQKDAFADNAVETHLSKLRELITMKTEDQEFVAKYRGALQQDLDAAAKQAELKRLLSV